MRTRVLLFLTLASAAACAQVEPTATSTTQMATPPPVTGANFPALVGAEEKSNFLSGGVTYSTAYVNNLYADSGSRSTAETEFSILPTVTYDDTATRRHMALTYSPGFSFYRPSSGLNEVDNTATTEYDFLISPYTKLSLRDQFSDSSTPFNPSGEGVGVSGAPPSTTPGVIPPFAKRLTNNADGELTMQTGKDTMVGLSGSTTVLHYPDSTETPGLYDSNSRGGSVFYNRRLGLSQYFGATYQYQNMLAYPASGSDRTQTHTMMVFYTLYPLKRLSLSVSAGPQYYRVLEIDLSPEASWGPFVSASANWHGNRTNFAGSYSQSVTGGGGLLGAFHSKLGSASMRRQMAKTWTVSASGGYSAIASTSALSPSGSGNGHTVTGTATLEHSIHSQFTVALNYVHLTQSYAGITVISANPNSDRATISINWRFTRPLGK